ncbi:endolytic transglycosylase MltG, partial [Ferruginibacter sp.]
LNMTPKQVYTMASIVEEETNKEEDKGKIASVYINRIETGMKLEADPTVKFAMKDFGLKRILHKHLEYPSPYNTYRQTGLPPGPICTPSSKTIDAVLNAPQTNYIFFVAKPDFNGYSNFATTYSEHLVFAKAYQNALDSLIKAKAAKATTP